MRLQYKSQKRALSNQKLLGRVLSAAVINFKRALLNYMKLSQRTKRPKISWKSVRTQKIFFPLKYRVYHKKRKRKLIFVRVNILAWLIKLKSWSKMIKKPRLWMNQLILSKNRSKLKMLLKADNSTTILMLT